jgi:Concanavalin A-like lectin/glucanases superfamily
MKLMRYQLASSVQQEGTIKFWIKPDSPSTDSLRALIRLSDARGSSLDVLLVKKTLELNIRQPGMKSPLAYQCTGDEFVRGQWALLAIQWNKSGPKAFRNGKELELRAASSATRLDLSKTTLLEVGSETRVANDDEFAVDLRDLQIWDGTSPGESIAAEYAAEIKNMSEPLLWRAVELDHFAGKEAKEANASRGVAWTSDTLIGRKFPITVPADGNYELNFRVKAYTNIAPHSLTCEIFSSASGAKNKSIAKWDNQRGDLVAGSKYQNFSIPFQASSHDSIGYEFRSFIPSKYSLILDTVTLRQSGGGWKDTRRFEDLEHTMGVWKEDAEAAGGRGWTNANTLEFGPYTCLGQPGQYRATWRVKIAKDVPENQPLLLLDAFAHDGYLQETRRGSKPYGKLALSAAEFQKRDQWENKSLDFRYDGSNMMEFRAFSKTMDDANVFIDTITVQRIE